jgi:hypothetical protein
MIHGLPPFAECDADANPGTGACSGRFARSRSAEDRKTTRTDPGVAYNPVDLGMMTKHQRSWMITSRVTATSSSSDKMGQTGWRASRLFIQ